MTMKLRHCTLFAATALVLCTPSSRCLAQANDAPQQAMELSTDLLPPEAKDLQAVKVVQAAYPEAAVHDKAQGLVIVKVEISETGDVESAELVSGDPVLAPAALDAAKQWKFQPFLRDGRAVKVNSKLPFYFMVHESVDAKGNPISIPSSVTQAPGRSRVSGSIASGNLIHPVSPVYPAKAKQARIQGTVILAATISKEGAIQNLRVVSGDPMLADAAVKAVRQWRYRPFLLKGEPTEIETTIRINFTM